MNKPELKTVYIPTSDSNVELQVGKIDKKDYYKSFEKERDVKEQQLITFTPEEYNQHIKDIIKETLDNAVDKADITYTKEKTFDFTEVDKESISNTFEDTFNKLKYE